MEIITAILYCLLKDYDDINKVSVFSENALQPLDLETEKIYSFLSGKSHLLFKFQG